MKIQQGAVHIEQDGIDIAPVKHWAVISGSVYSFGTCKLYTTVTPETLGRFPEIQYARKA
ncbi:hypothetical protein GCM10011348_41860 [Marinobacterium nitratireducens]|uniref:Uncharacterized protein n=1 Tax=Marinobacterium nitratireducens TaxID=518897 RepID=A0A917ZN78_9GAMM|nr:hypothetical protein GCM10011348_41860 [Marinobacterium nitratireducens]